MHLGPIPSAPVSMLKQALPTLSHEKKLNANEGNQFVQIWMIQLKKKQCHIALKNKMQL